MRTLTLQAVVENFILAEQLDPAALEAHQQLVIATRVALIADVLLAAAET